MSTDPQFLHQIALADAETGPEPETVVRALEKAAREHPQEPDYPYLLGQAMLRHGRRAEAVTWLERAVRLHPKDATHQVMLGQALLSAGRAEPAGEAFRAALRFDSSNLDATSGLGCAVFACGRNEEGIAILERVVDADPRRAVFRSNLGVALYRNRETEPALQCFEQAIRLAPDSADLRRNLGLALVGANDDEGALTAFRHAQRLDPKRASRHADLADALYAMGRADEAKVAYEAALHLDPACLLDRPASQEARRTLALDAIREELREEASAQRSLVLRLLVEAVAAIKHQRRRHPVALVLTIFLAVPATLAGWSFVRALTAHHLLEDEIVRIARLPTHDDAEVRAQLKHAVRKHGLRDYLDSDRCSVRSEEQVRDIACEYTRPIEVLPGFTPTRTFTLRVNEPYLAPKPPIIF